MFKLIIQDDEGKTTVVPLIRDEITIGRKEGNTIRLTERNVSRRHARIVKSNGAVVVEDLESYNGVKVNGTRIQGRVAVGETDRIQIGDYLLELKVDRGTSDVYPPGQSPGVGSGNYPPGGGMAMGPGMQSMTSMAPSPQPGTNGTHPSTQHMRAPNAGKTTQPMPAAYDAAPQSPMAMAETAPEPASGVAPSAGSPGRLVVVSSNFGGKEFVLDKPQMVIGRTDDNDVVVNHRSISRHHAKIVLEQGRYCIVDMQSSNGVRVNGEEYGKVELRRGDMIDLGHVRLRYVEPGEDFVFDRDAQLVDVATRPNKGGKGALWAGLSVIAVGAVVAVVFVTQQKKDGPAAVATAPTPTTSRPAADTPPPPTAPVQEPVAAPQEPTATTKPAMAPAASPDAAAAAVAAAPPPPKPEPGKQVDAILDDAKKAIAEERWVAALGAAELVLKDDPANAEAKKIQEQANGEFRHQTTYEKIAQARDAGKAVEVARLVREIPESSVYHQRAQADLDKMHDQYLREREAEAKAFAARGQCDKIGGLARRAAEAFPDAKAAVERAGKDCTPIAAKPPASDEPKEPKEPKALTDEQVTELLVSAKEAARNTNWADARKKSEEVLRVRPGDIDAISVAAMAACNLNDKDRAAKYIERLTGSRKNQMRQICASRGVLID